MKLLKPTWVNHDGKEIFGIDIHPDGSRFATGGQGEDCGKIVVWNTAPVISAVHEANKRIPKMLCQMDEHAGCVNCLRWSHHGRYLSSGGDDKLVMIWQLSSKSGSSTVFGTGGTVVNIENWKCAHVLRGHLGDILDIAWSPDDSLIATGSVDNSVIIWNAQRFPEICHCIKSHHGLVKGVTFDPVGKYIASQSDDKSLCIWNLNDFSLERKITEPFGESSGTTHALRLSWSPDGKYIVSAHAMNNGGPVAKIIERNGWKAKMDFVGHRKAVTCVRFNEKMFSKEETNKSQQKYVCCAIGSRDRTLSIWSTSLKRPLVVVRELFQNSIMDISWSDCGYLLISCSLDGTVAFMQFSPPEMGKTMSTEEKYIYHKKTYGTSIKASKSLILSSVVENAEVLKYQTNIMKPSTYQKKETKSKITSSSVKIASTLKPIADAKMCSGLLCSSSSDKSIANELLKQQKECKTKEGKRRIIPVAIEVPQDNNDEDGPVPPPSTTTIQEVDFTDKPSSKVKLASESPLKSTTTSTSVTVKRKADDQLNKKSKKKKKDQTTDVQSTPSKNTVESGIASLNHALHIPVPEPQPSYSLQIALDSFAETNKATIEVSNNLKNDSGEGLHYLRCLVNELTKWETCVTSVVNALTANEQIVCVACVNRSIHVFSDKGRRLLQALILDSAISILRCQHHFLMAVSSAGFLTVWDVRKQKSLVSKESLLPLLKDGSLTITNSFLNKDGQPIIMMSDHSLYTFNVNLSTWTLLSSVPDSLQLSADMGSCLAGNVLPKGPLHSMQMSLKRFSSHMSKTLRLSAAKQQVTTLAYLENQLSAALSIGSQEEYHFWLMTYTRHLVQSEDEPRLRDLCEDMLESKDCCTSRVLSYEKRDLLKDILPIIASNLRFQRFFSEFQHQLSMLKK